MLTSVKQIYSSVFFFSRLALFLTELGGITKHLLTSNTENNSPQGNKSLFPSKPVIKCLLFWSVGKFLVIIITHTGMPGRETKLEVTSNYRKRNETQRDFFNIPTWPLKGALGYISPNSRKPWSQMHLLAHICAKFPKSSFQNYKQGKTNQLKDKLHKERIIISQWGPINPKPLWVVLNVQETPNLSIHHGFELSSTESKQEFEINLHFHHWAWVD